jgi:nucleobase:cation symporter-1, NCS1 family
MLVVNDLYLRDSRYEYSGGFNWRAIAALMLGSGIALLGLLVPAVRFLYDYSWFVGFSVAFLVYMLLMSTRSGANVSPRSVLVTGID